jgi:spore coat protein U-like protein
LAPTAAAAAGTTDWRCQARADPSQTISLSSGDFARPAPYRQTIDLDCTFTPTLPGPSQVTLCIAAPAGENGGGPIRYLRRRGGQETLEYRLTAQTGSVPSALPSPIADLRLTTQPLYTVSINHGDVGTVSFRHQFSLVAEFQAIVGRFLPEGEYADMLAGLSASVHEGNDCGFLLWGPPADSLGAAGDVSTTVRVPGSCSLAVTDSVDFGVLTNPQSEQRDDGTIAVQCSPGTAYRIELSDGNSASGGTRRMVRDDAKGSPADYLAYQLLQPDGSSWGAAGSAIGGNVLTGSGVGTLQAIKVTGRIAPGTPSSRPGRYADSVIVTLIH